MYSWDFGTSCCGVVRVQLQRARGEPIRIQSTTPPLHSELEAGFQPGLPLLPSLDAYGGRG